jgi:hypothetical protein
VESIDEDWSIACGEWAAYGLWPDNNLSIRIIFVTQNLWYSREYRGIPLAPPLNSSPSPTVIKHVKYHEFQVPSSLNALAWFLLVEVDTDILPGHDASVEVYK